MKSCNPLNTYLTLLIAAMPVNFILLAGCKKNSSQQKSFVGLDADLDRDIAKGAAPSFVALQDWFKGDVPLDQDELRAGDVDYTVPETFDEEQWDEFSNDYKQGLIAYFQQQIDRVSEFQKVTKEKSAESTLKLNELLELETTEMYDIIRVLVDPDYKPVSNDLFAKLFAQDHLRNFVNRFSLNFLKRIYNQPGKEVSQRSILVGLEVEKGNFTKLLLAKYLDQQGATPAFVTSLSIACEKLTNFLTTLGAKFDRSCSLPPSGSLQLNSSISRKSAWNDLKGTGGHKFASSYGSMSGKNGYLAAARRPPRLSIFAGKDPSRGDPKGGGTQLTTLTDFKGSPKIEGASSFLASDWQGSKSSEKTSREIDEDFHKTLEETKASLPPKARFDCVKAGYTGLDLVQCVRNFSILPTFESLTLGMKTSSAFKTQPVNEGFSAAQGSDYSLFLITNYSTPVKNQGKEGACSAFGISATAEQNLAASGEVIIIDPWAQWSLQQRRATEKRPAGTMESALAAAKIGGLGQAMVTSETYRDDVEGMKASLKAGRALFVGSKVTDAWSRPRGGALPCGNLNQKIGHGYTIVGFDDTPEVFVVKNSWGDNWGEQGYYYLPYSCVRGSKGTLVAVDIAVTRMEKGSSVSSGDNKIQNQSPSSKPSPQSQPIPSGQALDCYQDYSKIRTGGSGVCFNSSSSFCYRYSGGSVRYYAGWVSCGRTK